MSERMWCAAAVAGLLVLSGCGGDDEPTVESAAPPPSAPPPTIAAAGGGGGQARNRRPNVPAVAEEDPADEPDSELPDVPPEQLFFLGVEAPGIELLSPEAAARENLYAIALPEPGTTSSNVRLELPEGTASGAGTRPATSPISLPEGFVEVPEAGRGEDGMPLQIRCEADDSVMVLIPGGLFLQGYDGEESNAAPAHAVQLDPFYMDRHEVTLAQFQTFRSSDYTPRAPAPGNDGDPPDHPVLGIAWRSAFAYCRWSGKELPTEAEWEKAARGPDGYLYPWGDGRVVWSRIRTTDQIDPVMSFHADRSVYGVYDLAGNAREWCADYYSPDSYAQAMERFGDLLENPEGPSRPSIAGHRVVRGNAPDWQLWYRGSEDMSSSPADVGFRTVLRIAPPEEDAETSEPAESGSSPPPTRIPRGRGPGSRD